MRRALIAATLTLLASVGGGWEAHACSCTALTPAAALRAADIAFTGLVTAVVDGPATADPRTVTFDVDDVYKGAVRDIVLVETPRTADDCGIDFVPAERYTVFAQREAERVTSGICDATAADAALLEGIATPKPPTGETASEPARGGRFPIGSLLLVLIAAAAVTAIRRRRGTRPAA